MRVLAQRDEWVDHEQIMDIACTSEAAHLQAEADKRRREAEEVKEAKDHRALEGERHPKKRGHADTAGSSIMAAASSSGGKKRWKVCAYCAKQGKFPHSFFPSQWLTLPRASLRQAQRWKFLLRLSWPKTVMRSPS